MNKWLDLKICPKTKMTYISSCGDLCDDEDIYPCVLEYLIQNCPHYADLREVEADDYNLQPMDELAIQWERYLRL
jgi:hypothetical protein